MGENIVFSRILFYNCIPSFTKDDEYMAIIPCVLSKEDLLERLAESLSFPSYFGKNWDALIDMFRDIEWIKQKDIHIIHHDLSRLPNKEYSVYVFVMVVIVAFWSRYPNDHQFYFHIPESEKSYFITAYQEAKQELIEKFGEKNWLYNN